MSKGYVLDASLAPTPQQRARDRLLSVCRSIIHLRLQDEASGDTLAKALAQCVPLDANPIFPNVKYLMLGERFMRYLERWDHRDYTLELDSRKAVGILSRAMDVKHLCIDTIRTTEAKSFAHPEVWKIVNLQRHWKLQSITFHNDVGPVRLIFEGVPLHRYSQTDPWETSMLQLAKDKSTWEVGSKVEILNQRPYSVDTSLLPRDIAEQIQVYVGDSDDGYGPCICCGEHLIVSDSDDD
ncbi:hypothetical protein I317_02239 [Kwoniella heveanensis CBS 569]|nr:hypothetical protein I317_02239 [Kwoniella heveanensis CBS 569]